MIDALVDVCAEVVPQLDGKPAAALCLELARLCEEQLAEPDAAIEWLTRARSLDHDAPVLEGLARLYDRLQRWAPLADVVEEQAAHTEDPALRLALLMRLGNLCGERLADPGHATIAYQLALKADPSCLEAASALEQLQGEAGQFQQQLATLDHIRERTRGVHREQVTLRMAEVARDGTHDPARAIELCRALLHDNHRSDPGFELLASLLRASQRNEELKTLFEARIAWTFDPRALAALHEQLGLLMRDALHDLPGAVAHLESAVSREPKRESALEALWQAREQLGGPAECVSVLQRLAPLREGAAAKVAWLRLAELLVQTGGLGSEALDAGTRALGIGPHEAADLQRLLALFQGLAAHEEATTVLQLQADAAAVQGHAADAVQCLFSAVALREKQARSAEVAALLEKIIALAPDQQRAYRELAAVCVRLEDWPGYAACLERWLPHLSSPAERLRVSLDLAGAQEQQLGDPLAAFATLRGAFRLAPADDALLEGLERLARVTGSSEALVGVLGEISEGLGNTPLAARRLLALARIADEDLDDVARATGAVERVIELQPRELAAFERLANLHARRGLFPGQVEALERKREALSRAEDRKTLDLEIARVREELIGDSEGAAAALTRALQTEPDLQTAVALVGVRRRAGRWAEAARALQLARDLAPNLPEKVQFQLEAAVLEERELDDDRAAIDTYRKALDMDPRCRAALDALGRLYRSGEGPLDANRARELLRIHQRQLDLAADDGERVALWVKCAALREDPLADPSGADACFESILSLDPRNRHALESLIRIRRTQRRWPELINALERLAKAATTRAERAAAHAQVGEVLRDGMSDPDRAIASYHQALEMEPSDRSVVHALGALYASRTQWPRALEMLQREAVLLGGKPEAAELHRQAGDIHLERLNDPSGAKACYRQALQVDSGHLAAIRALQRLYAREHDWRAYESMLVAEAEHLSVASEKRDAYLRVARHVAEKRHDVPGAKQWYEAALRADSECTEAAAPLAAQAVEGEDWTRAEDLILLIARKAEARASTDPRAAPEAARELFRLGDVYARRAKETEALDALQRAVRLDPNHQAAQERLAALYVDLDRKQEAVAVYEDLLTRFAKQLSLSSATATRCRVAELLSEMGQAAPARAHFERVLSQVPGSERALRGLTRLADQAGDSRSAASFRQKWLKVLSGEARFQVAVELARLAGETLGDHGLQVEACREALKVKPDALPVMESLAQAYGKVGQHDRSAQTLRMILDHPELNRDLDRRKRAYFELGNTVGTHLRDVEGAAAAFEAALDLDYRFVEPFRALEALLASAKRWRALDEAYGRMLERVPDSGDGKAIRTSLWKARGDVRAHALNDPGEALQAYRTAAEGRPDDAAMQEALGDYAARRPGEEQTALTAFRRALGGTSDLPKVCSAIAELSGKLHDYDTAYLATHALVEVLRGGSESERATLQLLVPHADAVQRASRSLTDRLW
ncbi:MAG TPA: tetratricopeptide repeat protein, partial [Myxococcaceae bacterium]|nr:tetratricopeptide repeat protein [Myxococcaceae bacterium]